jgi:hypothetical protein
MRHYLFAVVPDRRRALLAVNALRARGSPTASCNVLMHHEHVRSEDLPAGETSLRQGVLVGAVIGGVLGGLLSLLLLQLGLIPGAGIAWSAALTATAGALMGGVFGGIAGVSSPDRSLDRLERELREGKVVLSVETPDAHCLRVAEETLESEGAKVVLRPAF